jgi:hypothetical protein
MRADFFESCMSKNQCLAQVFMNSNSVHRFFLLSLPPHAERFFQRYAEQLVSLLMAPKQNG